MRRRDFIRYSLSCGTLTALSGVGWLIPSTGMAGWPKAAFKAGAIKLVLTELYGTDVHIPSERIKLIMPEIAQNGTVVPVTVESSLENIEEISILVADNPFALAGRFKWSQNLDGFLATRIKMATSSYVYAIVRAEGKQYSAVTPVRVIMGGCD